MARNVATAESAPRVGQRPGGGDAGMHPLLPLVSRDLGLEVAGRPVLRDLSFWIGSAERTVILGPNGAGKSVLLHLCHGLLAPTAGNLSWGSLSVRQARAHQAMVLQRPVLLRRSVAANLDHVLRVRGVPRRERRARIDEALERAALATLAQRPARGLSGGEQQRLAMVRACIIRPSVLLLDEPTANLDPGAARLVESLIRDVGAGGTKILMTTHDIAQARRLAADVLFLHDGRLLEHSGASEFFDAPKHELAARFLAGELLP